MCGIIKTEKNAVYVVEYKEMLCNYKGIGKFKITLREKSKGGTLT